MIALLERAPLALATAPAPEEEPRPFEPHSRSYVSIPQKNVFGKRSEHETEKQRLEREHKM